MGSDPSYTNETIMRTALTVLLFCLSGVAASANDQTCSDFMKSKRWDDGFLTCASEAEAGDTFSRRAIGLIYLRGLGSRDVDYVLAANNLLQAARQNDTVSQFYLAILYSKGNGVPREYTFAHVWASIAAENGSKEGAELRDVLEKLLTSAEILASELLTRECIRSDFSNCIQR
jgi:TPR repeat protein